MTALPLGNLVTVTTRPPADTGSTTFTLFVPSVGLLLGQSSTHVNTVGVTTTRHGGILPNIGPQEFYTVTELTGTAEFAVF